MVNEVGNGLGDQVQILIEIICIAYYANNLVKRFNYSPPPLTIGK